MAILRTCDNTPIETKEIEKNLQLALYNDRDVIITDTESNKVIWIQLTYDDDLMYRVYSSDVKIDLDAEKIIDIDSYLIKDEVFSIEDSSGEYYLPKDAIQRIIDKARSL